MKKISIIFGTRPEAIKLAPVILELKKDPDFSCEVCITAQHREMLDQVLEIFGIVPDVDLNLMEPNQGLAAFAAKALVRLDQYIKESKPDMILVQGDTTTVFTAALAAFYNRVAVGHVEAGLRSGNIYAPFPEEVNRMLATRMTSIHFAPTEGNKRNLIREGVDERTIHVTGNTVIDALLMARDRVELEPPVIEGFDDDRLTDKRIVLITGHRRESFGAGFEQICSAIFRLAIAFPDVQFVYPVHLNPNVQEPVKRILGTEKTPNIRLIKPLSYLPFVYLMNKSTLILTDSGGIQEEGPSLKKPVLVMRDVTERPEGVEAGLVKLVGTGTEVIISSVSELLNDPGVYKKMISAENPYGDGRAAFKIVNHIRNKYE
jgi:UDP-N-acetylglucosamine 2-epimerase (non-hydrolysing)